MDFNPPGSSVHRIFQARTLEQVAISFSSVIFFFFFFFNTILSDPFSGGITFDPHHPCSSRALYCLSKIKRLPVKIPREFFESKGWNRG